MAYTVNPPQVDEATGEFVGEPQVTEKFQRWGTPHRQVDGNPLNEELPYEAIDVNAARVAVQQNLPIFNDNADADEVAAFWNSKSPLSEAEIDAIQSAYVATDNELIAQLLQYRLGLSDGSDLPEYARFELGLDDTNETNEQASPDDVFTPDVVENLVLENATEPSADVAQAVVNADLGDSPAAVTVQYLATKYYTGEITAEQAYSEASNSGIDTTELYSVFTKLYNQLSN